MFVLFTVTSKIIPSGEYFGIKSGSSLNISCTLTGVVSTFPYDISWYHNGYNTVHKFTSVLVKQKHSSDYVISTLQIFDSEPENDEGVFQCSGNNSFTVEMAKIRVKIFCEFNGG